MAFEEVVGIACLWKYHWETVAADVALNAGQNFDWHPAEVQTHL